MRPALSFQEKLFSQILVSQTKLEVECHNVEKKFFRSDETTTRLVTGIYELCDIK